ncbi:MAG: hypothetical protein ACI9K2_006447 [Myxococcota bacterium]|jgi:hypothetical protein
MRCIVLMIAVAACHSAPVAPGVVTLGWTTDEPAEAITADLDGDGLQDLIYCEIGHLFTLSWRPGLGGGEFDAPIVLANHVGSCNALLAIDLDADGVEEVWAFYDYHAYQVFPDGTVDHGSATPTRQPSAADLDGDGDLDLVVPNWRGITLCMRGADSLDCSPYYPYDGDYWDAVPLDIDRDGDPDIVAGGATGLVWLENTRGVLAAAVPLVDLPGERLLAVDVDGDGWVDLVRGGDALSWSANLGAEAFGAPVVLVSDNTHHLLAADMDGDDAVDLVGADETQVRWFHHVGDTFLAADLGEPGAAIGGVQVSDVDDDGDPDLLVARGGVEMYDNADLLYTARPLLLPELDEFNVADLDGGGWVDLVGASFDVGTVLRSVNVFGRFTEFGALYEAGRPGPIVVTDVSGDGLPDLVAAEDAPIDGALVMREQAAGRFDSTAIVDVNVFAWHLLDLDLDGDGDLDLLADVGSTWLQEDGAFLPGPSFDSDRLLEPVAADLDGDGRVDVLGRLDAPDCDRWIDPWCGSDQPLVWHPNLGDGALGPARGLVESRTPSGAAVGDVTGDGVVDLISWLRTERGDVELREGLGGGAFAPSRALFPVQPTLAVHLTDIDLDGALDLVLVGAGGGARWHAGAGDGTFGADTDMGLPRVPLDHSAMVDVDRDGDVDLVAAGSWIGWWSNPAL